MSLGSPKGAYPRVMTDRPTRWGILATGSIARQFAQDLMLTPDAVLTAVGSRRIEAAQAFAAEFGGATAHGSYEELVADPDVDVVYVATPHSMHLDNVRIAFEAGKHVLCEKPVTLDVATAEEMVALAGQHGRFLMEAMWTACHPVVLALRDGIAAGRFGTPRHLRAELGAKFEGPPDSRIFDPALGASAMLDVGIYPLTFAHLLLGRGRGADRPGRALAARLRPRCQRGRSLPRRRARHHGRVDDVVVVAHGGDRDRHSAASTYRTPSTTRRTPSSPRSTATRSASRAPSR